ncbi:MAG: class I SAM-dependent methyltransferase [Candidatus Kerfeldbacteria bacterium]|nr:class I SAM-dependent methyltransferase [Candidatus Kerfeldbacteria bacterium]
MGLIIALSLLVITILFAILAVYIFIILLKTKVPFVRTPFSVIETIVHEVHITNHDVVYDLGCGNARVLLDIERATGARVVGYELSPWAYFLARMNVKNNKSKAEIRYQDFYKADLSEATVVFAFLIVAVMPKVGAQLEKQLKPGTTVVCYGFSIPQWIPTKTIPTRQNDPKASKIYIYKR